MQKVKILLIAFEPFAQYPTNPSQQLVAGLKKHSFPNIELVTSVFPVQHKVLKSRLLDLHDKYQPQVIIGMGLAAGSPVIKLERYAVNIADFQLPDNSGKQLDEELLSPDGPIAYQSSIPCKKIVRKLLQAGIPAQVSNSAGTYLCNNLLYEILHLQSEHKKQQGTFIHFPMTPQLAAQMMLQQPSKSPQASMSLSQMLQAIQIILENLSLQEASPL